MRRRVPNRIDIRNGPQLDCIQCGLCIDARDTVMTRIGPETRLIGYDNDINIHRRKEGKPPVYRSYGRAPSPTSR